MTDGNSGTSGAMDFSHYRLMYNEKFRQLTEGLTEVRDGQKSNSVELGKLSRKASELELSVKGLDTKFDNLDEKFGDRLEEMESHVDRRLDEICTGLDTLKKEQEEEEDDAAPKWLAPLLKTLGGGLLLAGAAASGAESETIMAAISGLIGG